MIDPRLPHFNPPDFCKKIGLEPIRSEIRLKATPTQAAAVGAFHEVAGAWMGRASLQAQYTVYKAHKLHPRAGLLVVLSFLCDLRDLGHAWHLWRALLEVDRLIAGVLAQEPICLVEIIAIRSDAIEACRRRL